MSNYQHRVTIGIKAVTIFDGISVGGEYCVKARKCPDEGNQCGLRKMKIGNHRIDYFEFVTRLDK